MKMKSWERRKDAFLKGEDVSETSSGRRVFETRVTNLLSFRTRGRSKERSRDPVHPRFGRVYEESISHPYRGDKFTTIKCSK